MWSSAAPSPAVHDAGREVLDQDIGARDHFAEELLALLRFEVERDRLLVRVEHRERQVGATQVAAAAQMLAVLRLDLDHRCPGQRHEEGRVRPVVDMGEVEDGDAGEWVVSSEAAVRQARHGFVCDINFS